MADKDIKILLSAKDEGSKKVNDFKMEIETLGWQMEVLPAKVKKTDDALANNAVQWANTTANVVDASIAIGSAITSMLDQMRDFSRQRLDAQINSIKSVEQGLVDASKAAEQFQLQIAKIRSGGDLKAIIDAQSESLDRINKRIETAQSRYEKLNAIARKQFTIVSKQDIARANSARNTVEALKREAEQIEKNIKLDKTRLDQQNKERAARAATSGIASRIKASVKAEEQKRKAAADAKAKAQRSAQQAAAKAAEDALKKEQRIARLKESASIREARIREDSANRVAEILERQRQRNAEIIQNNLSRPFQATQSRALAGRDNRSNPVLQQAQRQVSATNAVEKEVKRTTRAIERLREDLTRNIDRVEGV